MSLREIPLDVMFEAILKDFQARLIFRAPRSLEVAPFTLNLRVDVAVFRVDDAVIMTLEALTPGVRPLNAVLRAFWASVAFAPDKVTL